MNLVDTRVVSIANQNNVTLHGDALQIAEQFVTSFAGQVCTVGIRPEDLHLSSPTDAMMTGRIDLVEYTGSETLLSVLVVGRIWKVKVNEKRPFAVNETVHLRTSATDIYIFNQQTKQLDGTLDELLQVPIMVKYEEEDEKNLDNLIDYRYDRGISSRVWFWWVNSKQWFRNVRFVERNISIKHNNQFRQCEDESRETDLRLSSGRCRTARQNHVQHGRRV